MVGVFRGGVCDGCMLCGTYSIRLSVMGVSGIIGDMVGDVSGNGASMSNANRRIMWKEKR